MRTIICKKCGAPIDADLGECPVCGAVYYILPKEDGDETRVWDAEAAHTAEEISSAIKREEMSGETKPLPELKPDKPAPADKKPETPSPSRRAPAGGKDPSGKGKSQPVKPAAKGPDKRLPNRSWIFVVTAAVLLAVLTVVLCVMSGVFDFGGGASKMPDLVGLTRDVAVDQLQAIGINPNIVYEESTEPDGVVLRQSPDEGAAVDNSTVVTLTVSSHVDAPDDSQDTQTVAVPDVMGLSYDQAVQRLRSAGLTAVVGAREHSAEAEDTVTRQSPLSGAMEISRSKQTAHPSPSSTQMEAF